MTSTVTRMSCSVCCRLTERSSSRGAAPKMSAAIHGVDCGSSNHEMNDVMPAWATRPTAERRLGGMSPYHGSVSSRRLSVAVERSPEMVRSQASVSAFVLGFVATSSPASSRRRRSGRAGGHVVQAVLLDRLRGERAVDLAALGEQLERAHDDRRSVDLEEPTRGRARVREAEAVGAERGEVAGHALADLVGHGVHEVAHGDERAAGARQLLRDVRRARLGVGVEEVVLVGGEAVAAQLGPAT